MIRLHAKIMLLPSCKRDEANAGYAEKILIDISAAFGHTFSLMRGKIGEKSIAASGEALTDETVEACQQCQAVFVCDAAAEGLQELFDALDLPLSIRSCCVPVSLCGRHEKPVSLFVGTALSLDEETLRQAMRVAFLFSQEEDVRLCPIAPTGSAKADWEAAVRVQEAIFSQISASPLSAPEAISAMIASPERAGLLLCPPYAGSIFTAAATALCNHPSVINDLALDESIGIFAPYLPPDEEVPSPVTAALATAKMLRYSLRLAREAACVEAAVNNVLSSGWRVRQNENAGEAAIAAQGMLELIGEQITVAGELMHRGGLTAE